MSKEPEILEITYLDHCSDDTEKTLLEIQSDPLSPTICTIIGYKTFENEEYITISSEKTNHNTPEEPYINYNNHITIIKSTIKTITRLKTK
jgi:hypothetical protein